MNPWALGLPLILAEGVADSTARKFIGKVVSRYGKGAAERAFKRAQEVKPVDVRGFVLGLLEHDARTFGWQHSNAAAEAKARELGIAVPPGASYADLRRVIRQNLNRAR